MSELTLVEKLGGIVNAKKYLNAWSADSDPVINLGPVHMTRQALRESIADYYLKSFNGDLASAQAVLDQANEIGAEIYCTIKKTFYKQTEYYIQCYIQGQWQNIINKSVEAPLSISNLKNAIKVYE